MEEHNRTMGMIVLASEQLWLNIMGLLRYHAHICSLWILHTPGEARSE